MREFLLSMRLPPTRIGSFIFLVFVTFFSIPVSAKTIFLHSYRDQQKELDRFADLNSQDYKHLAGITYQAHGKTFYRQQYPDEFEPDPDLGYKALASSRVRHVLRTDNEIIYDVIYSFDKFSRRISPIDRPKHRKRFVILSGCSFTYGSGLSDDQTLNYYLGKALPDYFPYNYGIGGTGANSMLALVEENRFHKEIPQKQGVFIYVSLGTSHVDRTTGKLPSLDWLKDTPYYEVSGNTVVRHGSFTTGRPKITYLYLQAQKLLEPFHLGDRVFPPLDASDFHEQCMIAKKARDTFLQQYPESHFIYYLHPFAEQPAELDDCLRSHGVYVVHGHIEDNPEKILVMQDGHPTGNANEEIAANLAKVITALTTIKTKGNH